MSGIFTKEQIETIKIIKEVQELEFTVQRQRELLEEAFLMLNDDFIQSDKRKEFERKLGDHLDKT